MTGNKPTNVVFSAGLGPRGRAGAWVAALIVAAGWMYIENSKKAKELSINDVNAWNEKRKKEMDANAK
ncbi:hypothetical protein FisN_22Lu048 [Fistulifera solaris]|uniref:Uncharacterized protein n=1 Tax=Fistulifera solaris TaxID=1519565 RepID=A0A1Z5JBK9_FISSO|nr:hypothetical protein FisN_22Lu048 [Fistulifera solaris]|eukprot:GAX11355.1 hypothetical protein FisN_22Lu048 [Fistulifera solaris]